MTEAEAVAYVKRNAQTSEFPVIEDEDVLAIVQENMRAQVWQPNTAYPIGARVQPTTPNGHFYQAIEAGTSDEIEPDWTNAQGSSFLEFASDLRWREIETDPDGNLYNLRNAIHDIWFLKASKSANQFDVSIDSQKWTRSQIYDHCMKMAWANAPID